MSTTERALRSPDLIRAHVAPLIDLASARCGVRREEVASLCETLLALPEGRPDRFGGESSLNHDGSPLQVCLTGSGDRWHGRVICDPASLLADPLERADASRAALDAALAITGAAELADLCRDTWQSLLPSSRSELRNYVEGVTWLAGVIGSPGFAVYVDGTRGTHEERWERVRVWMASIAGEQSDAARAVAALSAVGSLMCAGLEGIAPSNTRAKLYWRLRHPAPLEAAGIPMLATDPVRAWLAETMGERKMRGSGAVFSAGFAAVTGDAVDVKIDLCAHCLGWSNAEWQTLFDRYTESWDVPPLDITAILDAGDVALSYVGFGIDARGRHRLNVYFRPAVSLHSFSHSAI